MPGEMDKVKTRGKDKAVTRSSIATSHLVHDLSIVKRDQLLVLRQSKQLLVLFCSSLEAANDEQHVP
jgi:hypothetical protein